jgi:macrodomain Ter protein organizer (MatP/YcbG family)
MLSRRKNRDRAFCEIVVNAKAKYTWKHSADRRGSHWRRIGRVTTNMTMTLSEKGEVVDEFWTQ